MQFQGLNTSWLGTCKTLLTVLPLSYFQAISGGVQRLLLTVCSGITPGGFRGPDGMMGIESWSATCKCTTQCTITPASIYLSNPNFNFIFILGTMIDNTVQHCSQENLCLWCPNIQIHLHQVFALLYHCSSDRNCFDLCFVLTLLLISHVN